MVKPGGANLLNRENISMESYGTLLKSVGAAAL